VADRRKLIVYLAERESTVEWYVSEGRSDDPELLLPWQAAGITRAFGFQSGGVLRRRRERGRQGLKKRLPDGRVTSTQTGVGFKDAVALQRLGGSSFYARSRGDEDLFGAEIMADSAGHRGFHRTNMIAP
jgi:hypothetical protein